MTENTQKRPHAAWQWNPPARRSTSPAMDAKEIQSSTECTGLMQHVPEDEGEAHALCDLYSIHAVKPKGNIGKGNPRNNPEEIAFHRES